MKKNKLIYIIIVIVILGFVIYKKFIEVPGHIAGQMAIEELISQVYYEDVENYFENIFIKAENNKISSPLPEFDNINNAPQEWIWMVLYNNLENEENIYTYEEINEKIINLFSDKLNKRFPEDGITGIIEKNTETGMYYKVEIADEVTKNYGYSIKTLTQEDNIYKIYIVEYTFLDNKENGVYTLMDRNDIEIKKYNYKDEIEKNNIKTDIEIEISQNQYNLIQKEIVIEVEEVGKPNVISIIKK